MNVVDLYIASWSGVPVCGPSAEAAPRPSPAPTGGGGGPSARPVLPGPSAAVTAALPPSPPPPSSAVPVRASPPSPAAAPTLDDGSLPGGSLTVSFGPGAAAWPHPALARACAAAAASGKASSDLPGTPAGVDGHRAALGTSWTSSRRTSSTYGTGSDRATPPPPPPPTRPLAVPSPARPGVATPPPTASPLGSWAGRVWVYPAAAGAAAAAPVVIEPALETVPSPVAAAPGSSSPDAPARRARSEATHSAAATPPGEPAADVGGSGAAPAASAPGPDAAWSRAFRRRWARVQARAALQARGVVVASPPRAAVATPAVDLLVPTGVWQTLAAEGGEAGLQPVSSLASLLVED